MTSGRFKSLSLSMGHHWLTYQNNYWSHGKSIQSKITVNVRFLSCWSAHFYYQQEYWLIKFFYLALHILCKWTTCMCQTCLSNFIYSWHLASFGSCCSQIKNSLLCVCPLIEDKFCHNIVKVCCRMACGSTATLAMLWCNLSSIRGQKHKNWH